MTPVQQQLRALAEPGYRAFASSLLPGVDNLLGVRLPILRRLSRKMASSQGAASLAGLTEDSFEETMLQGMIIGCLPGTPDEVLPLIAAFVPKITNWSLCDSFCSGLKIAARYPDDVWDFLIPYLSAGEEFAARFGVVMLLLYYLDDRHIDRVLALLDTVEQPEYYARMAVAWAVSACYVRYSEKTLAWLDDCRLDAFTCNKALQKAMESRCVTSAQRALLRARKRQETCPPPRK